MSLRRLIAALMMLLALTPWLPVTPCDIREEPLPDSRLLARFYCWPKVPVLEIRYLFEPLLAAELATLGAADGLANMNCFLAGPLFPAFNFISWRSLSFSFFRFSLLCSKRVMKSSNSVCLRRKWSSSKTQLALSFSTEKRSCALLDSASLAFFSASATLCL